MSRNFSASDVSVDGLGDSFLFNFFLLQQFFSSESCIVVIELGVDPDYFSLALSNLESKLAFKLNKLLLEFGHVVFDSVFFLAVLFSLFDDFIHDAFDLALMITDLVLSIVVVVHFRNINDLSVVQYRLH